MLILSITTSFFITLTVVGKPMNKVVVQDTLIKQDTIVDVKDKYSLFIGDSHTSNLSFGWQKILSTKTKMKMFNVSVLGKTTGWMLEQCKQNINRNFDYCFIYGGANDMYTKSIKVETAVKNVQMMVNLCNRNGVHPVVITGFNPLECVKTPENPNYPLRYRKFQDMLVNTIEGADVIITYDVKRTDCWDGLCHMAQNGHKKIANTVIKKMKFKTY